MFFHNTAAKNVHIRLFRLRLDGRSNKSPTAKGAEEKMSGSSQLGSPLRRLTLTKGQALLGVDSPTALTAMMRKTSPPPRSGRARCSWRVGAAPRCTAATPCCPWAASGSVAASLGAAVLRRLPGERHRVLGDALRTGPPARSACLKRRRRNALGKW